MITGGRKGNPVAYYDRNCTCTRRSREGDTITEAEKNGVDNPYGYSTKEWDQKFGLYYFSARYYSPEIGRHVSGSC